MQKVIKYNKCLLPGRIYPVTLDKQEDLTTDSWESLGFVFIKCRPHHSLCPSLPLSSQMAPGTQQSLLDEWIGVELTLLKMSIMAVLASF